MHQLRKMIGLIALSLVANIANASFYTGIAGGPEVITFSVDSHIIPPGANVYNTTKLSGPGYFGSIFAGYGECFLGPDLHTKNIYLAAEVNANASNAQSQVTNNNIVSKNFATTTYKMDHSFGLSFLPGFLLTESTLFYLRLGYSYGNFKVFTNDVSLTPLNRNVSGCWFGLGARYKIKQHFSLLMDVSQTNYQGVQMHTLSTNNTIKDVNISPVVQQFELGILYDI